MKMIFKVAGILVFYPSAVFIVAGTAGEFEIETVIPFEKLTPELLRNPLYQDQRIDY